MPLLSRPVATQASSTPNTGSSSSNSQGSSQEQIARQQYLSPFSAVDPSVQEASSSKSSQQQDPAENDKWGDVLSVNHTLSSLYIKNFQVSAVPQQHSSFNTTRTCTIYRGYQHAVPALPTPQWLWSTTCGLLAAATAHQSCRHVTPRILPFIPMLAVQVEPVKQRDWEAKRRENDLKDVAQAGSKLGVKREVIEVRQNEQRSSRLRSSSALLSTISWTLPVTKAVFAGFRHVSGEPAACCASAVHAQRPVRQPTPIGIAA